MRATKTLSQRDPLFWRAGMNVATVKRVSVTMSRVLGVPGERPNWEKGSGGWKTRPQSGLRFLPNGPTVTVHPIGTPQPDQLHPIETALGLRSK